MKKTRFLALVLVVAIALMGAGYAYWTEILTIDTTVNAGELSFRFLNNATVTPGEGYTVNGTATVNLANNDTNDVLKISLNDMYPGAEAEVIFTITNTGTMDAVISNYAFDTTWAEGELIQLEVSEGEFMTINEIKASNWIEGTTPLTLDHDITQYLNFRINPSATVADLGYNANFKFNITSTVHQHNGVPVIVE